MRRVAESPGIDVHLDHIFDIDDDHQRESDEIEVERFDPALRAWLERGTADAR